MVWLKKTPTTIVRSVFPKLITAFNINVLKGLILKSLNCSQYGAWSSRLLFSKVAMTHRPRFFLTEKVWNANEFFTRRNLDLRDKIRNKSVTRFD